MDFVRNALKSERDTSIAGRGNGFKARLSEIDNAMARDCYRYGNAKLLQSHGQRAQNIGQTARLGEGHAFCRDHQNVFSVYRLQAVFSVYRFQSVLRTLRYSEAQAP